jgi:hypothetical protein
MRHLLCVAVLAGAMSATLGCSSSTPPAPPAADTDTDLGAPGSLDKGNPESTGSTTN